MYNIGFPLSNAIDRLEKFVSELPENFETKEIKESMSIIINHFIPDESFQEAGLIDGVVSSILENSGHVVDISDLKDFLDRMRTSIVKIIVSNKEDLYYNEEYSFDLRRTYNNTMRYIYALNLHGHNLLNQLRADKLSDGPREYSFEYTDDDKTIKVILIK